MLMSYIFELTRNINTPTCGGKVKGRKERDRRERDRDRQRDRETERDRDRERERDRERGTERQTSAEVNFTRNIRKKVFWKAVEFIAGPLKIFKDSRNEALVRRSGALVSPGGKSQRVGDSLINCKLLPHI
jgi:hypothetical protein